MPTNYVLLVLSFMVLTISCGGNDKNKTEEKLEEKSLEVSPSGLENVAQLLELINSKKIQINQTATSELADIYNIAPNDYYMNTKIDLEDHTLYINFTISNNVLNKVSYATLSNAPKDFSYINDLVTQHFGEDYSQTYTTNDSVAENMIKTWTLDSIFVTFETFSDLNSGYELSIK